MERKAFLDQEPPPGYVAGVGRGATGFTTSADTGPVRFESHFGTEDDRLIDSSEHGMLSLRGNTDEDDEADKIYEAIEKRLEGRRKRKEPEDIKENGVVTIETGTGIITSEFQSLKPQLASVTAQEWENLPEVGDLTRKNKRQRILEQQSQRTYAAPDVLIASTGSGFRASGDDKDKENDDRDALLEELDQDAALRVDLERSKQILASLRKTEPHKADSWISSARLEEQAKNLEQAKKLIVEGCNRVPHSELVWLESLKIHRKSSESTKLCKYIVNEALRLNSKSEKLWFEAVNLENPADVLSRKRILMKALEFLPSNVRLWKALIDLEEDRQDAKRLLQKATELCPEEWELWQALLELSDYSESKKVLNSARKQLPQNPHIWVAALKLEEREDAGVSEQKLSKMLSKGIKELSKHDSAKEVSFWLDEAATAELEGLKTTAKAIVNNYYDGLPEGEMRISEVFTSAEKLNKLSASTCVVQAYDLLTQEFPHDINCWSMLFTSLRNEENLDKERVYRFYEKAVESNPNLEVLRLMYAKDAWIACSDISHAREVLIKAEEEFEKSEKIQLARFKLETKTLNFEAAFNFSRNALDSSTETSVRLWYKYIHLLRFCQFKSFEFASRISILDVCDESLSIFKENFKLYLQKAQILEEMQDLHKAREVLSIGSRQCPSSIEIPINLAKIDIKLEAPARARSILDKAILDHPKSADLWVAKIDLEMGQGDMITARQLVNKSRQLFSSAPAIWIHFLKMIPKMSHRKNAFLDALKSTNNAPEILLTIGVFFWLDGQFTKAHAWFNRALNADSSNGDAWGWAYCFYEKNHSDKDKNELVKQLEKQFDQVKKGDTWISVVKNYKNFDKSPRDILVLVAHELLKTKLVN
ncbi:hypothetical_protein [Candidozyma auris]|uniref:U4/U6-U5 snRNP complex subunit PRP6 n=1 Tax=Candidozyma auris TaxID=498019 RepID=UPI000D26EE06|nr:U4/U6-U5 snRNP complex subunit PRP6 [[Candida] auris]QEO24135.1 hypothetical_protein [[Candida] auris]GBL52622.1 putative putative PEP-CTERM system TPR-repeat lipoprotein [[Candida] auris]